MTTTGTGYVSSPQAPSNETQNQNTGGYISEHHKTVVKATAIIQIVLGVLSIISQSISSIISSIIKSSNHQFINHQIVNYQHLYGKSEFLNTQDSSVYVGIWCGILFLINGVFGIISTKRKSTAWVNTVITTNSIIVVVAVIQLSYSSSAITDMTGLYSHCRGRRNEWGRFEWMENTSCDESLKGAATAMNALMVVSSLVYVVLSLVVSCTGCSKCCCCCRQAGQDVGGEALYGAGGRHQQGAIISTQAFQQPGAAYPPQVGVFTQAGAYPAQARAYPPQAGAYPSHAGAYPPHAGDYPPQAGAHPPQSGAYHPQAGAYLPQGGAYPPRGGIYSPPETYPSQHDPAGAQPAPPSYESVMAPPAENS